MDVLHICTILDRAVRLAKPEPFDRKDPVHRQWFHNSGQAAVALNSALEGHDEKALKLAAPIAEHYGAYFDEAQEQLRASCPSMRYSDWAHNRQASSVVST